MELQVIQNFIKQLASNNSREWFQQHKAEYDKVKKAHEEIVTQLISQIALFDEDIKGVQAKDCIFRIYRDVRFSPDKSPYKNHIGAYIASRGGRKSERAGYYLHIGADESFLSGGIYCPRPNVLKALREAVYHNIDEYLSIINQKEFKNYFTEFFSDSLKKVPQGFPKDFEHVEYLKYRHYSPASPLSETLFKQKDYMEEFTNRCKALHPYNRFMNFTVDECLAEE